MQFCVLKFDYTYWSSPVKNQKLIDVSPKTISDKFFSYNTISDTWKAENPTNTMTSGTGYIIRSPQDFLVTDPSTFEAVFRGIPFNGKVNLKSGKLNGFNLIGNPYSSAISADSFLLKNKSNISGALYFWTHNTPFANNKYTSDDYATYNLMGGVGTRAISSGLNETIPNGSIASGQAFFVLNKNSEKIDFENSMRIPGKNGTFFKPSKTDNATVEKHRIWLNLKNSDGVFKQILIGYATGATNSYDSNYDAQSINGNKFVNFFSINENKNLVIQGRSLPFDSNDKIDLGYLTTIAGNFTISIDHVDGDLKNQSVYLEDKSTNILHDLTAVDYSFSTSIGTFKDRFVLHYVDNSLETKDFQNPGNAVLISVKNKIIQLNAAKENLKEVTIYDLSGKVLYTKKKIANAEFEINLSSSPNQVLLVKTTLENGNTTTNKIIF